MKIFAINSIHIVMVIVWFEFISNCYIFINDLKFFRIINISLKNKGVKSFQDFLIMENKKNDRETEKY